MEKNSNLVIPIIFFVCLIIGCGVIVGQKVLESKQDIEEVEVEEPKEQEKEKVIEEPTLGKDIIEKDVTKYIQDEDYEVVPILSNEVKDLYKKYFYGAKITDNYLEEKITNDMIISITMEIMYTDIWTKNGWSKEKSYLYEEKCEPSKYDSEYGFCKLIISNEQFNIYAKKLFGNNVQYDITKYSSNGINEYVDNCCYFYYSEEDKSMIWAAYGTGCGVEEWVETAIDYAYKKDDKLVIIEKSLFFASDLIAIDGTSSSYENVLYNSVKKEKKLDSGDKAFDCNPTKQYDHAYCLTKYKDDVTYYAYTFEKNSEGNYYLSDFSRLNKGVD